MAARTASFSLSPTVKRKWLAALRSGKYKQGDAFLYNKDDNSYCCLGVLCEIEGANTKQMESTQLPSDIGMFKELVPTASELTEAQKKLKYNNEYYAFSVMYKGKMTPLAYMNDDGISFAEIADVIEKKVPTH